MQYHAAPMASGKFTIICVYQKQPQDETVKKHFIEFYGKLESKIKRGKLDESRLTMSMTQILSELIDEQKLDLGDAEYEESNEKLERIEIELDEIA